MAKTRPTSPDARSLCSSECTRLLSSFIVQFEPLRVIAAHQGLPPTAIVQVPLEGLPQALGKISRGGIAQVAVRFPVVNRVTAVVAKPVAYMGNEVEGTAALGRRRERESRAQ